MCGSHVSCVAFTVKESRLMCGSHVSRVAFNVHVTTILWRGALMCRSRPGHRLDLELQLWLRSRSGHRLDLEQWPWLRSKSRPGCRLDIEL